MNLSEAVQLFLDSMRGVNSDKTVAWYAERLAVLVDHFGGDRALTAITIGDLRKYRMAVLSIEKRYGKRGSRPQENGHLSLFTVNATLKAAKRLFSWLHTEGILENNPAARLELPPIPTTTRTGVNDDDAEKIIHAARTKPRDYALVLFLRDTGCRIGGACSLRLEDLDLQRCQATVVEKGSQQRVVYFGEAAAKAIQVWLELRPDWVTHSQVFCSYGGKPLIERGVYEVFRRLAAEAGVDENWSPHQWRHRKARKMLGNGANLQQVSQLLGHKSIEVTSRFYGKLAEGQLRDAYFRYYEEEDGEDQGDD